MDVNELLAIAQSNATLNNENSEELRDTLLSPLEDMRVEGKYTRLLTSRLNLSLLNLQ